MSALQWIFTNFQSHCGALMAYAFGSVMALVACSAIESKSRVIHRVLAVNLLLIGALLAADTFAVFVLSLAPECRHIDWPRTLTCVAGAAVGYALLINAARSFESTLIRGATFFA